MVCNHYYWGWEEQLNHSNMFYDEYFLEYESTYQKEPSIKYLENLKKADLVISQEVECISEYSDKFISEHINNNAKHIRIANWFFEGFWPYKSQNESLINCFPFPADEFGKDLSFSEYMNHKIDLTAIQNNFDYGIEKLFLADLKSDIKLFDFFTENYKEKRLFLDAWHPSPIVFQYLTNEILKLLEIKEDVPLMESSGFKSNYRLITNTVRSALDFSDNFMDDSLLYFKEKINTEMYYEFSKYIMSRKSDINIPDQNALHIEFKNFLQYLQAKSL